jgi:hypothetical protein
MAKAIRMEDGSLYRMRRGKLVKIPDDWVGNFTTPATIRKRDSKKTGKLKRATKNVISRRYGGATGSDYIKWKDAKDLMEFENE